MQSSCRMTEERKSQSWWHWWQTIPGVLTAIAGIITAVTGLIVALNQSGLFWEKGVHKDPTRQAKTETGSIPKTTLALIRDAAKDTFFDDFSGDELNPRWTILNRNPSKTTVQPKKGTLLIVTERGSIAGTAMNLKNQYVLDLNLPKGNYEVIAKASFQIQSTNNSISLGLFKDDDNFLELMYWGRPSTDIKFSDGIDNDFYRTVSFVKEELGRRTAIHAVRGKDSHGPRKEPWHFVLKIERNGNEYSGYFAPFSTDRPPETIDQLPWTKFGTHAWIDFDGKLSMWARNGNSNIHEKGPPQEVAAEFDFVLLREK